jgi:hypothetical protein
MIIVSGCPRSGTSLTMDILREAVGDDNIMGSKFPQDMKDIEQGEGESDAHFAVRQYYHAQSKAQREQNKRDNYKDLNPNGFWECRYSVMGIGSAYGTQRYNYFHQQALNDIYENKKDTICKIVSQGLLTSDQRYIDKVIYLIRHPRNVAKSQERLQRGFDIEVDGEVKNIFEGEDMVIHTPEMYIGVTLQACRWILDNPDTPILFIKFDDIQSSPDTEIDKIAEFVGYGDFEKARGVVSPKLNRSNQEDIEHHLWKDAELVYDMFLEGKYEELLEEFTDPNKQYNRLNTRWTCVRSNTVVNCFDCEKCVSNPMIRENAKDKARILKIDYMQKPCVYECGLNVDEENPKTIEESINNNTWAVDDPESRMLINQVKMMDCGGNVNVK